MKYLVLLLLCACAHPALPDMVRPDTRRLSGVVLDSASMRETLLVFRTAYPNEAAMCYYGAVRDTILEGEPHLLVFVTEARPAVYDSADSFHVWFPRGQVGGCVRQDKLVGVSHAHQHTHAGVPCSHSHPDAWSLMENRRALFSLVFCADGQLEVLFQDGRRLADNWLKAFKK